MMSKKRSVKIADLDVNVEELQKKDPHILKKIRGGQVVSRDEAAQSTMWASGGCTTKPVATCGPFPGTRLFICPPPPSGRY